MFLVEPYVPSAGVVFLHGKTSIGKSPLSWELARCVALGAPFLGCQTQQGTVLYIEVDTPSLLIQPRLKLLPQPLPERWHLLFARPFNSLDPTSPMLPVLKEAEQDLHPDLVIVNTLRKVHYSDDKESNVPFRVYAVFQAVFPNAAVWFNHHDKKSGDPSQLRDESEEFSGSQAWKNDATVGLHLVKHGGKKGVLRLDHTKTQVSEQMKGLVLQLEDDGSNIGLLDKSRRQRVLAVFNALDDSLPRMQRYEMASKALKEMGLEVVPRTVRKYVTGEDEGGEEP